MVKNSYLLPLISKIMDKLKGTKYFTKLDVRWGYNNIQIRKGDEWKAAFKTNKGLFKPTVDMSALEWSRICGLRSSTSTHKHTNSIHN
jgi:hypothetical protein